MYPFSILIWYDSIEMIITVLLSGLGFAMGIGMSTYSKRGGHFGIPKYSLRGMQETPASFPTLTEDEMIGDVLGEVAQQPQSVRHETFSLQTFLLDMTTLLDDGSRSKFESVASEFITTGLSKRDIFSDTIISGVIIEDQRLAWKRLEEGKSMTGLEVSFEVVVAFLGDVEQEQLAQTTQLLFDRKAKSFRRAFDHALNRSKNEASGKENEVEPLNDPLEPLRVPLGLAAVGIAGLMAILSLWHMKKDSTKGDDKGLSVTDMAEENYDEIAPIGPNPVQSHTDSTASSSFPVQQVSSHIESGQQHWDDISLSASEVTFDEASCDNSYNQASNSFRNDALGCCPGVGRERKDLTAIFESDQSEIAANLDQYTDSDSNSDSVSCAYSTVGRPVATLTSDDLQNFDDEIRRAEC